MPKPFYADYVNHMVRAYSVLGREGKPAEFKSEVDASNYEAVDRVLNSIAQEDKDLVLQILSKREPIAESINKFTQERGLEERAAWTLVSRVSGKIAKDRKLI